MDCFVRGIPQGAAYPDGIVIPQVTPDFTDNHGNCIGGKFYTDIRIEIVNGFDQPDASDLEQVVHVFITVGKTLDYT